MIIIYKELIQKYISYLKESHIQEFAMKNNISLSQEEVTIIYQFIKKNYLSLIEDNTTILELKKVLREDLYQQLYSMYQEYKTTYL